MASQITHIVVAEKTLSASFKQFDAAAFLVGTVFPDIRYLRVIDRTVTHFSDVKPENISNESNSFTAGMKYHSLVDERREAYVVEKKIYDLIPSSKFITQALKVYEDEVLYAKVSDWPGVIGYLDTVFKEEMDLVAQEDQIKKWHTLMQNYFRELPTDGSRTDFILELGFSREVADEINGLVQHMRHVPEIREAILAMYDGWDLLIS